MKGKNKLSLEETITDQVEILKTHVSRGSNRTRIFPVDENVDNWAYGKPGNIQLLGVAIERLLPSDIKVDEIYPPDEPYPLWFNFVRGHRVYVVHISIK